LRLSISGSIRRRLERRAVSRGRLLQPGCFGRQGKAGKAPAEPRPSGVLRNQLGAEPKTGTIVASAEPGP
jgi:hypothetical protein